MTTASLHELAELAATELIRQHAERENFSPLKAPWQPGEEKAAYAVQDAYVRQLEKQRRTKTCGYKIALTTPTMRQMVGFANSISGRLFADQMLQSGTAVYARSYGRLIIEFEFAFGMAADVPKAATPWTANTIMPYVGLVYPALEVADDRNADYATLNQAILTLIADNAWNQGLVLGKPVTSFTSERLANAEGVVRIDGMEVGRGAGRDVMGHPLRALAWLANHLQARNRSLSKYDLVTTGSLVASKFPVAGNRIEFSIGGFGEIALSIGE